MNKVHIMGRICRDLELKFSNAQEPVAILSFSVAVNRKFKKEGQPEADFINVKAFGKTAENIQKFFSKGKMIQITGRIQTGSYEKDGVKVYTTDIMAEEFNFTGEKKEDGSVQKTTEGFYPINENIEDDDLPF
jgi:single-strand DNA-binding protein